MTHAYPRMNYARSLAEPQMYEEFLSLLDRYLQLAPAMVPPPNPKDMHSSTLWHPALHLDNVLVDPESKHVTHIIDWQATAVLPFFYQCGVPIMFRYRWPGSDSMSPCPNYPENYSNLEPAEKAKIDHIIRCQLLHKFYLGITLIGNPRHWAALQLQDDVRTQPARIVQSVWKDCDWFFLQRALIRIIDRWEDLCPGAGPCPVSFNEQEMALYRHEEENRGYTSNILKMFRERWGLLAAGYVESARFDVLQTELEQKRDAFARAADTEEGRLLADKLWPYRDTERFI